MALPRPGNEVVAGCRKKKCIAALGHSFLTFFASTYGTSYPEGRLPAPAAPSGTTKDVMPLGELKLATLGRKAADTWDASPLPALLWCSKAQLRAAVAAFAAGIGTADAGGDAPSPAAARLAELDREIENSLKFVKNYLIEEHGSRLRGQAYY